MGIPVFISYCLLQRHDAHWILAVALVLFAGPPTVAQKAMPTTGKAILDIGNGRDIQDARNDESRSRLMQAAVLDAIERVASIDISVASMLRTTEARGTSAPQFSEQYMNETLQRYHVRWQRVGDYAFQRDDRNRRVWICSVAGTVEQLQAPALAEPPQRKEERSRPYVQAKRHGTAYLGEGTLGAFNTGERYEVLRRKGRLTDKPVGRIVVKEPTGELPATARIVAGRYAIKERYTLRPASFPIIRGGLRVGYFQSDALPVTDEQDGHRSVSGYSFDYFEYSLLDGLGIALGLDLIVDQPSDSTQFQSIAVRLGGSAQVALVPEVLYLRPTASIGYAQPHQAYGLDGQLLLQGQLDLCLNLGPVELFAGGRYLHLLMDPGFNGAYAVGGLGLDLYRFIPATYAREKAGLRAILGGLSLR